MAELIFFTGTMDCGKSTLALQTDWTHRSRGRTGILFTRQDRGGSATISSRLGLSAPAVEVTDATDFWREVTGDAPDERTVDYVICDEVQFYRPEARGTVAYETLCRRHHRQRITARHA